MGKLIGLPMSVISQFLCRINVFSSIGLGEQWDSALGLTWLAGFVNKFGGRAGAGELLLSLGLPHGIQFSLTRRLQKGLHLVSRIMGNANSFLSGSKMTMIA
jgi:hypothetical protein